MLEFHIDLAASVLASPSDIHSTDFANHRPNVLHADLPTGERVDGAVYASVSRSGRDDVVRLEMRAGQSQSLPMPIRLLINWTSEES